ncbi:MOSC domain-containing protein [Streptomyces sp. BI20]|uniref:MOSC domain-containing protein n=1 Tax=Streptomyces sp. BI20 TaxID=3403460 RepID=UPI003C77EF09
MEPTHTPAGPTGVLVSLNVGRPEAREYTDASVGVTAIGKRPVPGPLRVTAPGPKGEGGSGVEGDTVCDRRYHGGDHQAVYAYAREDLDWWGGVLERELAPGLFGENLTTVGLDVNGALIGERWRVGGELVLEVASARIPCRTFQGALDEGGWVKRFTQEGRPGAYLRVITPGPVSTGDAIEVIHRPEHEVTVAVLFRALTTERALLPQVLAAGEALGPSETAKAREWIAKRDARGAGPVGG